MDVYVSFSISISVERKQKAFILDTSMLKEGITFTIRFSIGIFNSIERKQKVFIFDTNNIIYFSIIIMFKGGTPFSRLRASAVCIRCAFGVVWGCCVSLRGLRYRFDRYGAIIHRVIDHWCSFWCLGEDISHPHPIHTA